MDEYEEDGGDEVEADVSAAELRAIKAAVKKAAEARTKLGAAIHEANQQINKINGRLMTLVNDANEKADAAYSAAMEAGMDPEAFFALGAYTSVDVYELEEIELLLEE